MTAPLNTVALELLDSTQSQRLQYWEFPDESLIRIGRAADNDVVVGSPYVSRAHAYLKFDNEGWELTVLSDKGVFVEGRRVDSLLLNEGTIFRLSAQGPFLRVAAIDAAEDVELGTVSFDPSTVTFLSLDAKQRDKEVDEISRGAYFKDLQKLARDLRAKHQAR